MLKKSISILLLAIISFSFISAFPFKTAATENNSEEIGANVYSEEVGFSQRTTPPPTSSAYYYNSSYNPFYSARLVTQCTWYAWGRAYEIMGKRPNLSTGNAKNWFGYNRDNGIYSYSTNFYAAKPGAILCCDDGGATGHVAIVEEVAADGSPSKISEGGWYGSADYTANFNYADGYYGAQLKFHYGKNYNGGFQGYIYLDSGTPDPDPANIISGVYVIHSAWDDNIVLDIAGDSKENDANIQLYQRVTTNDVQKFRIIRYGDYYCIKSVYSDLWFDVKLPIGDNSNVKLYYDNSNEENDWQFIDAGDGYYYIRNRTGYYLDVQGDEAVNHANVQLYHYVGTKSQKWRLEDVTKYVNAGGVCKIRSSYDDNMCLDIAGNSKEDRANIQLYENTNDDVQKFRIYKEGNYSCFKSVYSGKWLDIGLPIQNKANVQLWGSNDSDEEKWIFEDAGNGYVYIQSKTGFYLDLEYDNPVNRANIQIYRFTGNNSQRWRIEDLTFHTPVEEGVYTIHSAWNDNMCLDIQGNSTENRANVILYQYENTNMQKYRVYKYGEYYCLKSIHADKWLDIKTPFGNNSNVQLWASNNADEEYWIFEDAGNGYVYIRSKLGYYLDLQGDNPVNWANIQIYNYVGTNSQKWKLKRDLEPDMVTVTDVVTTSDATSVEPSVTVKVNNKTLTKNTDYSVDITADIADGKGIALITGKGDYCGSITKEFSISIIPPKHEIGDTDLDGRIDIRDVTAIQRHIAELEFFTEVQLALADTNGDRKVDIADATHLQMYLAEYDVQLG